MRSIEEAFTDYVQTNVHLSERCNAFITVRMKHGDLLQTGNGKTKTLNIKKPSLAAARDG